MSAREPANAHALSPVAGARRTPARDSHDGGATRRVIEGVVLLAAGALFATATINDDVRQVHVNHRLDADLRTWRAYTGHDYRNVSISQDVSGLSTRDVSCGNTSPGPPKERIQICLQLTGPVRSGMRRVSGGWYLPPRVEDLRGYRYACFGPARGEARCPR